MLGVSVLIDKFDQSIEMPIDEHNFNKRSNEGTVAFRQFKVNGHGRPIYHDATRLVWPMSSLDIVPVLYCLSIFEPENFEADFATCEIVLCMCKYKITIFKSAYDIYPR